MYLFLCNFIVFLSILYSCDAQEISNIECCVGEPKENYPVESPKGPNGPNGPKGYL